MTVPSRLQPSPSQPKASGAVEPAAEDERKRDPVGHLQLEAVDDGGHDQDDGHQPDRPVLRNHGAISSEEIHDNALFPCFEMSLVIGRLSLDLMQMTTDK